MPVTWVRLERLPIGQTTICFHLRISSISFNSILFILCASCASRHVYFKVKKRGGASYLSKVGRSNVKSTLQKCEATVSTALCATIKTQFRDEKPHLYNSFLRVSCFYYFCCHPLFVRLNIDILSMWSSYMKCNKI